MKQFDVKNMYSPKGRHGQFLAGKAATVAATSAGTFYSAKSRQALGLGGLASRGGPADQSQSTIIYNMSSCFGVMDERMLSLELTCNNIWHFLGVLYRISNPALRVLVVYLCCETNILVGKLFEIDGCFLSHKFVRA